VRPLFCASNPRLIPDEVLGKPMRQESRDDALDILRMYDTVIVVDDSPSMTEEGGQKGVSRWSEVPFLPLLNVDLFVHLLRRPVKL
jgi:hypothetical protein